MNATSLSDLRKKCLGMLSDPGVDDMQFVAWLHSYSQRANEILHPVNDPFTLDCPEGDIRREYNRFGTGVSGQRVVDWAQLHGLTLPHNQHWWFIRERQAEYSQGEDASKVDLKENPPSTGHIEGVPNSEGYPRITNGIDVYIERFDGTLLKGHRDWLRWHRRPKNLEKLEQDKQPKAASKLNPVIDMAEVERLLAFLNT